MIFPVKNKACSTGPKMKGWQNDDEKNSAVVKNFQPALSAWYRLRAGPDKLIRS
jgi:hypothetical protein